MEIRTIDGIAIYCLPDSAVCILSGKTPLLMDECPKRRFDDFGMVCQPGECDFYTEELGERKEGKYGSDLQIKKL